MKFIVLASAFFVLAACNYNKVKGKPDDTGLVTQEKLEDPDYETVHNLVLRDRCVGCHRTGNENGANLENYQLVRAKWQRVHYRAIEARTMPKNKPLSPLETELLKKWIDNGLPEKNIGGGAEKPGDIGKGPTNFSKIKNVIFKTKCLDCHQVIDGKPADGNLDLTDVKQVREKILPILDLVVGKGIKPPAPYPAVTPAEREALLKWYNLGMPE